MNKDIRVLVSFKNHRKRKRLKMVLGESGTDYLIDLWLTAADDRPDGILIGWDDVDIAISCGWEGEPQKIVQALIDTKWLDLLEDGTYSLHDWVEHNGYASSAEQRSDKARFSNLKRWHPKLADQLASQGIDALTSGQFKAITDGQQRDNNKTSGTNHSPIGTDSDTDQNPNPPSPSPSPTIVSSCPEPKNDSGPPPPVLEIPLIKKDGAFHVTQEDIDQWQETFPGIDVPAFLKIIRQWNLDNPTRRKTRSGVRQHISTWLGKEQNKAVREGKPMAKSVDSVDKDKILEKFRKMSTPNLQRLSESENIYAFEILRERGEAIQPKTKTMEAK